ncbi:MAG: hypothetical protein MI866_15175 [Bacteroidales bacterium]|nr:hypothetical protein [Bacteroidales bacterium]
MKTITTVLILIVACACNTGQKAEVNFVAYTNYFVKNTVEVSDTGEYLHIKSMEEFKKVFGVAATMSEQNWLQESDFNDKVVIAILKNYGNNAYKLKITGINRVKNRLVVDYEYTLETEGLSHNSTGYTAVLLNKHGCQTVKFYENGKFAYDLILEN